MTDKPSIAQKRAELRQRLFPAGIPALWCPSLTHYDGEGRIDGPRIAAQLRHLSAHVRGFLIPGSTGDGWELSEAEFRRLLEIALEQAQKLNFNVLIGVLKPGVPAAVSAIHDTLDWIKSRTGERETFPALAKARVCGFTVCPPHGREMSQGQIECGLSTILELGLPTAVYQLPQVTKNEIGAEVVGRLAATFENFLLFKDSSGADRVALSAKSLDGVFAVRGAEGDYARWLTTAGGPYQGFLLSTANCFGAQLGRIIEDLAANRIDAARQMSERLSLVIGEAFRLAEPLPDGNAYANANKAMDHYFAYGPRAAAIELPRLHAGSRLPVEMVRAIGELLARHDLMPSGGYL